MAAAIKRKIENLIAKAKLATGNDHADLTSGVNALIEGYGQGEPVPEWNEDYTLSDDTEEITGREPLLKEKTVTENREYLASDDGADGYSKVVVNVPIPDGYVKPEGNLPIAENGDYDVTNYASVKVNVASTGGEDSPLPILVTTEAKMDALLKTAAVGAVYKYVGVTGVYETNGLYVVEESE